MTSTTPRAQALREIRQADARRAQIMTADERIAEAGRLYEELASILGAEARARDEALRLKEKLALWAALKRL